jgi:hypothetical protein
MFYIYLFIIFDVFEKSVFVGRGEISASHPYVRESESESESERATEQWNNMTMRVSIF